MNRISKLTIAVEDMAGKVASWIADNEDQLIGNTYRYTAHPRIEACRLLIDHIMILPDILRVSYNIYRAPDNPDETSREMATKILKGEIPEVEKAIDRLYNICTQNAMIHMIDQLSKLYASRFTNTLGEHGIEEAIISTYDDLKRSANYISKLGKMQKRRIKNGRSKENKD